MPVLAADRVRYSGEPVVLVAAETPWAAEEAASLVELDIEEQPGVFDAERALAPDAPHVHADGNRFVEWRFCNGDAGGGACARADLVVEGDLPHAARRPRLPGARGRRRLDRRRRRAHAARLHAGDRARARRSPTSSRFPHERVRVIGAYMGGGFGGKEDMTVEPYLALLVVADPPAGADGVDAAGVAHGPPEAPPVHRCATAPARRATDASSRRTSRSSATPARIRCSARGCCSPGPPTRSARTACDDVRAESLAVFTNTVPNSAFRGFGAMQVVLAHELQMDRIAELTGLDRVAVRRLNFAKRGDLRPERRGVRHRDRRRRLPRRRARGAGSAAGAAARHRASGAASPATCHPYGRNVFMNDHATAWIGLRAGRHAS